MAGYSGTPLAAKLGIKPGMAIAVVYAPPEYLSLIEPLPDGARVTSRVSAKTYLVHLFVTEKAKLAKALADYREKLEPAAVLWISWPKKAAKVETDICENTFRDLALPLGWGGYQSVCRDGDLVWTQGDGAYGVALI